MAKNTTDLMTVILAAGEGSRMRSSRAKVLHQIAHLPLIAHVTNTTHAINAKVRAVVIGPNRDDVSAAVTERDTDAKIFTQKDRLGTAHALNAAREVWQDFDGNVLVLLGDAPLMSAQTLQKVQDDLAHADMVVVGFEAKNPHGYGRMLMENDQLRAIREEKDASDAERKVTYCNSGTIGFRANKLVEILDKIDNKNSAEEYLLTDAVEIANALGLKITSVEASESEVQGINTRAQLANAEADFQHRARQTHMLAGVTLIAPETVFFAYDTQIEPDVTIEPHVVFGPGVTIASGAQIKGFSHLEGATIGPEAAIGPYARLRPGAQIGAKAKVGNFCEIKKADVQAGAKVNHLSYIGDATIGAGANIGAGTITCNYDGFTKSRTVIGAGAFVGSNSSLVAPIEIGAGAYVGSGSTITENVAPDALALGRARQTNIAERAKIIRARGEKNRGK